MVPTLPATGQGVVIIPCAHLPIHTKTLELPTKITGVPEGCFPSLKTGTSAVQHRYGSLREMNETGQAAREEKKKEKKIRRRGAMPSALSCGYATGFGESKMLRPVARSGDDIQDKSLPMS